MKVKSLSHVQLLVTPWTAAYQAPLSMGFSRQEYWSGLPLPSPLTTIINIKHVLGDSFINTFCCKVLCIFYMRAMWNLGEIINHRQYQDKIKLRRWGKRKDIVYILFLLPFFHLPCSLSSPTSSFLSPFIPRCAWENFFGAIAVNFLHFSTVINTFFFWLVLHPRRTLFSRQYCFSCVVKLTNDTWAKRCIGCTISVKVLKQVHVFSWEC